MYSSIPNTCTHLYLLPQPCHGGHYVHTLSERPLPYYHPYCLLYSQAVAPDPVVHSTEDYVNFYFLCACSRRSTGGVLKELG